ncbi:ankyrin repeat-containing domain protein [Peziza echinospora]|nr:ankyrin repeat-containing domain protein [Peziza echinospora]
MVFSDDIAIPLTNSSSTCSHGNTAGGAHAPTAASSLPFVELATAAAKGDIAKVESLLRAGVNPNHPGPDGLTPLGAAASAGNTDIVQILLRYGADYALRMANERGWAPLHLAAYAGHLGVVDALVSAGANTNQPAAPAPAHTGAAGAAAAAAPPTASAAATTALNLAAYTGHADIIRRLLAAGADANAPSAQGVTPLQFASIYGKVEAVSALLSGGAKASINQTAHPTAPLPAPAADGGPAKAPRPHRTALFYAAQYGHPEIVKVLLDNGAQPGIADKKTELTPLHIASKYGRLDCVKQLLPVSDPNRVSKKGFTPLKLAQAKGWGDVVGLFGSAGARGA